MNTVNMPRPSGPDCARYAPLLPQFRQGTLASIDDANLRAHLATCAYCRARLAIYDRLDTALAASARRFARTAPAADELVRGAIARVAALPTALNHHRPDVLEMRQREDAMFDPRDPTYDAPTLRQTVYRPPRDGQNNQSNHTSRTRPVLATIAALLLIGLAAALFTLFARPGSNPAQSSTPTVATQATATTQPTATPQPTQNTTISAVDSGHPCSADPSGQTSYVYMGDLKVSKVAFSLAYPANQLPSNLDPSKPYRLPDHLPNPRNSPINPGSSYSLTICNTSNSASHVIQSLIVGIAAFTAYSGTLNTYMFCDPVYQRVYGLTGGGCGGGRTLDENLQASFAADATTGAQAPTTQVDTGNAPPLPVSLGPGQMLIIVINVVTPTAPGTYTFSFGLNYDSLTDAPISTMQPTLFDSAAVKWSGANCNMSTILSQIPTSDPTGGYVCAS